MRQLSRASGAALLVPAAVFGSMVLLALAGGFGSLGGLGQALGGPSLPSGARSTSSVTTRGGNGTAVAALLPVVARSAAPTLVASVALPNGPTRGGGRTGGHPRSPGGSNGSGSTPTIPIPPTGSTPPTSPTPAPGGAPVSTPQPPRPTLIDGVVSLGTSITSRIPGPLGQLATSTLQNVGHTVDGILPHAARSAVSRVTGTVSSTVSQVQNGVGQLGSRVSGLLHAPHVP
jgi:hypothetical protein